MKENSLKDQKKEDDESLELRAVREEAATAMRQRKRHSMCYGTEEHMDPSATYRVVMVNDCQVYECMCHV